jgi:hypothetical protein
MLKLGLAVHFKVAVIIKKAGNYKFIFVDYILNISVYIEDVIIYQLFLILKKKANACILSKLFETII